MTKLRDVYDALVALSKNGVCDANQRQILQLVKISRRHLARILRELEAMDLIRTERHHQFRYRKTKNRYHVLNRPGGDVTSGVTSGGDVTSGVTPCHDSCMHGENINKKEILKLFDFIDEPMRSYCAGLLDLETARAWRAFKDYYDANELWPTLGLTINPVGWIIRRIKSNDPPPPLQLPLPGGSLDIDEFRSRGQSKTEIESNHHLSKRGCKLDENGFWS